MRYATFCSGIGAPEVAWAGLSGWECIAQAEIAAFPSAVLRNHWPDVPNLGDLTAPDFVERLAAIGLPDLVCAGIPCQPFSVAGLRQGVGDKRNLTQTFVEIADAIDDLRLADGRQPAFWLVENVPGLLSDSGNAFGALLAGLCGSAAALDAGGSWPNAGVVAGPRRVAAWRVLDAALHGVPQRRRRVFILARGGAGRWACADALLPIVGGLRGDPAAGKEAGQDITGTLTRRTGGGCLGNTFDLTGGLQVFSAEGTNRPSLTASAAKQGKAAGQDIAGTLTGGTRGVGGADENDAANGRLIVGTLYNAEGSNGATLTRANLGKGVNNQTPLIVGTLDTECGFSKQAHQSVMAGHLVAAPLAIRTAQTSAKMSTPSVSSGDCAATLQRKNPTEVYYSHDRNQSRNVLHEATVRRLVVVETERLQGLPDGHTAIIYRGKPAADGLRYAAVGNSMAVPVMTYIGERIAAVCAVRRPGVELL